MRTHVIEWDDGNRIRRISRPGVNRTIDFPPGFSLFRLYARDGSARFEVRPRDFARITCDSPRAGVWQLCFSDCRSAPGLGVQARLAVIGDELRFTFRLDAAEEGAPEIYEADLPVLPVDFRTGRDRLLIPSDRGDLMYDPYRDLVQEGFCGHARFVYPGRAAMQYTEIYSREEGVYFSAYNLGDETFDIGYQIHGGSVDPLYRHDPADVPEGCVNLFHRYYPYLKRGKWLSPVVALALHRGDWHAGADLYRRVMARLLARPEAPRWMRDGFHGWVKFGCMKIEGRPVSYRFADLPGMMERAFEADLPIINVAGWGGVGFDTRYPDRRLNPEVGSEAEAAEALAEIRERGGRVMLYTNGRLVDTKSAFAGEGGSEEVVVDEDGSRPQEYYDHSPNVLQVACPTSSFYRAWLADAIAYTMSLGADAVQIDQVSMAPALNCFDPRHDHSKPSNNWIRAAEQLCRENKNAYRSINPDSFAWIEGVHELFGQYYEVSQCHGEGRAMIALDADGARTSGYPEMFRYTYPWYIVTGCCSDFGSFTRVLLEGKPFDVNYDSLDTPEKIATVRTYVGLRKKYPEFYLHGTFKDTTGFTLCYGKERTPLMEGFREPVMARAIESQDGSRLLLAVWHKEADRGDLEAAVTFDEKYAGPLTCVYPEEPKSTCEAARGPRVALSLRDVVSVWIK